MKNKIKTFLQTFLTVIISVLAIAGIASAVTTISANIATDGALSVTGISTLTGATTVTGLLTTNGGISIGANALTGTTGNIDYTNFDVLGASGNTTIGGTLGVTGNAAFDTNTLFVDAQNNEVGIGTASPGAKLQINSDYTATVPFARAPELLFQNNSNTVGNTTDINNLNSFGFVNSQIQFKNVDQGYKGAILFNTRSAVGEYGERMRVNESGYVGIGTTGPTSALDILRSDANSNILSVGRVQTGASGGGYLYFRGGSSGTTTRGYFGFTSTGGFGTPTILTGTVDNAIALRSEGYLYFGSGGDNIRMTIREDGGAGAGYVGIGTTAPAYQLQVQSAQTTGTVIGVKNTDTGGRGYGLLSSGSASSGGAGKLYVYDDIAGIRMALDSAGNVGIGTSAISSGQKLEINGGVTLATVTSKPACSSTTRGTFWAVQSGAGVKDTVEVCAKDAADAYAWRAIY